MEGKTDGGTMSSMTDGTNGKVSKNGRTTVRTPKGFIHKNSRGVPESLAYFYGNNEDEMLVEAATTMGGVQAAETGNAEIWGGVYGVAIERRTKKAI